MVALPRIAALACAVLMLILIVAVCTLIYLMRPSPVGPPPVPAGPAPAPSPGFNVEDARDTLHFAWAAYCNKSALEAWNCQWCNQSKPAKLIRYIRGVSMGTQGYVAVDRPRNQIIVAIRGSNNPRNYIQDGMLFPSHFGPSPADARVHHGFMIAFQSIGEDITDAVAEGERSCPECEVLVTGHSLGAAMATLAASKLALNRSSNKSVRLFTFGSPRVGNAIFARWASALVSNRSMRMVREYDLIPSIPPQGLGYRHLPTEIWDRHREGKGDWYIRCDTTGEDPMCSNSEWALSIDEHTRYMGFKGGYCRGAAESKLPMNASLQVRGRAMLI
eukprot:TRINITY_DN34882_c0_g1_i1.p1 TRINITY_DN34882_c0_g1~~TRINITY_DN34882_c0_g1_i1.p1  ORF type:complete len:350 (-),score=11.35 TRINITY_DN34882_c0_g1_i1:57-1052(-)